MAFDDEKTRPLAWTDQPVIRKRRLLKILLSLAAVLASALLILALASCSAVRIPENVEATRDAVEAIRIDVRGLSDQVVSDPALIAERDSARRSEADRKQERRQTDQQSSDWLLSLLGSLGLGGGLTASLVALALKYWQAYRAEKKLEAAYDCAEVAKQTALEHGADKRALTQDLVLAAQKRGVQSAVAADIEKRKRKKQTS